MHKAVEHPIKLRRVTFAILDGSTLLRRSTSQSILPVLVQNESYLHKIWVVRLLQIQLVLLNQLRTCRIWPHQNWLAHNSTWIEKTIATTWEIFSPPLDHRHRWTNDIQKSNWSYGCYKLVTHDVIQNEPYQQKQDLELSGVSAELEKTVVQMGVLTRIRHAL
jgi:hypothetical protein